MELRRESDGRVIITHDRTPLSRRLAIAGGLFAIGAAWEGAAGSGLGERFAGLITGSAMFLVAALACLESARFVLDPTRRTIEWHRRFAWRRSADAVSFDQVVEVRVERPIGAPGPPSGRVVLALDDGTVIPIAIASDRDGTRSRVAERVRTAIAVAPHRPRDERTAVTTEAAPSRAPRRPTASPASSCPGAGGR